MYVYIHKSMFTYDHHTLTHVYMCVSLMIFDSYMSAHVCMCILGIYIHLCIDMIITYINV